MSAVENLVQDLQLDDSGQEPPSDLSALLESLAERLHEPSTQERWYPGSAAGIDTSTLPYYRCPTGYSMTDLLAAALVRPAGISFDFEDWLEMFERSRQLAGLQLEARMAGRYLRLAGAGAIAGGVLALGCSLVALTVMRQIHRPNPYVAFAIAFGGLMLVVSVAVAIWERHWRATKRATR